MGYSDLDYVTLSAMLNARRTRMLNSEICDRMLMAPTYEEAAKEILEIGYEDMSDALETERGNDAGASKTLPLAPCAGYIQAEV